MTTNNGNTSKSTGCKVDKLKISYSASQQCTDTELLSSNLATRFETSVDRSQNTLQLTEHRKLSRVPGIGSYKYNNQKFNGFGGKPTDTSFTVFTKLRSKTDFAVVLRLLRQGALPFIKTEKDWDLRVLRLYCPSIKQVDSPVLASETVEDLEIPRPNEEQAHGIYRSAQP